MTRSGTARGNEKVRAMQIEKNRSRGKNKGRRLPSADRPSVPDGDEVDRFVGKLRALGPEAEEFGQRLMVANAFDLWADCPNESCRRAGKCRGEDIGCFDERRAELVRKILQHVVALLCIANVSSDEFYDYLDEVTADADDDGDEA